MNPVQVFGGDGIDHDQRDRDLAESIKLAIQQTAIKSILETLNDGSMSLPKLMTPGVFVRGIDFSTFVPVPADTLNITRSFAK